MGTCKQKLYPNFIFAEIEIKIIGLDESTTFVTQNISKPYINGYVERADFNYVTFCYSHLKFNIYDFKGRNNYNNCMEYPKTDALIFIYHSNSVSGFMEQFKQILYMEQHAECKVLIFLTGSSDDQQEQNEVVEFQNKLKIIQIHHVQKMDLITADGIQQGLEWIHYQFIQQYKNN